MGISGGGGGGGSASQGYGYNAQLSQMMQQIWQPQAAALGGLYGQTSNLMNQQMAQVPGAAQTMANQVMPQAQNAYNLMAGYANPNSQLAQQQLSDYSSQVGQNFQREILPGIRSGAGLAGGMGGSRAAVAQGIAAGDAARAIAQGGTDFYSRQYELGAQAAQQMPQMGAQIYNMGMAPYSAAWAPLTSAAGIFGGPTPLSAQQSMGYQEDWNAGRGNPTKPQYGFQLF